MILVDTSVWIDHLRRSEHELREQLSANNVLTHPVVIGELAGLRKSSKQTRIPS